ncbi:uncharacterized protein L3040_005324 [Drepanopeziza brunnea f. sp. 'multigermtubi']|uniref:uncharacterized protein n=1 Tax=Drepanopeziza brunnea f. sp. 'multigermtubi' TaxID=698441 RepID=UPI0023961792|nr:hypothetical protein L3040_005324 [Drepanopeziza brunnea f. sp. 'multigermtubi']
MLDNTSWYFSTSPCHGSKLAGGRRRNAPYHLRLFPAPGSSQPQQRHSAVLSSRFTKYAKNKSCGGGNPKLNPVRRDLEDGISEKNIVPLQQQLGLESRMSSTYSGQG